MSQIPQIVIVVEGGCVRAVYCDESLPVIEVIVVDEDNIDCGDESPKHQPLECMREIL